MQRKMFNFLTSLGLLDVERFDLDFLSVSPNPQNPNSVDFLISKDTPWEYESLNEFLTALGNVKYEYTLSFSYGKSPDFKNAAGLIISSCLSSFRSKPNFEILDLGQGKIGLKYKDVSSFDHDTMLRDELTSLFNFISYRFDFETIIETPKPEVKEEPITEEPQAKEPKPEEITEITPQGDVLEFVSEPVQEIKTDTPSPSNSSFEGSISNQENVPDAKAEGEEAKPNETPSEIDEESLEGRRLKHLREAEKDLLSEAESNYKAMMEERKNRARYKLGDYKPIDHVRELYILGEQNIDVDGVVYQIDRRTTSRGGLRFSGLIGDREEGIYFTGMADKRGNPEKTVKSIDVGDHIRLRGAIFSDKFKNGARSIQVHFVDKLPPVETRKDPETEKRVELHLHTKMSPLDGASTIEEYCKLAKGMGMTAIGLTDHGCVQSFPKAQIAAKENGLKMIYGTELYMFDQTPAYVFNPAPIPLSKATYCVFDTETTGLSTRYDRIIEFGGVIVQNGIVVDHLNVLIDPEMPIPPEATAVNHITDEMVHGKPKIEDVLPQIVKFLGDHILVAHNATFDIGIINAALERHGYPKISNPVIDTLPLSHYLFPASSRHNEAAFLKNLGLDVYDKDEAHRAAFDAEALNKGFQVAITILENRNPGITHADLGKLTHERSDPDFRNFVRYLRDYHCCVLVKNQRGLKDLYRIVSESYTTYFSQATAANPAIPKTPKDLLARYRENLLVGSACFNGEVFQTALNRGKEELIKTISFYDYVEIQPLENYSYLINMKELPSKEHLIEVLRDIVAAAREAGVPVVATGDVHYADPEDKLVRDVYISAKAKGGGAHPLNPPRRAHRPVFENPDQHFRSTKEMLDCFREWCSEEEAKEFVVTNSNFIANQIEPNLVIVTNDTKTPDENLPHSDLLLRELCETNFKDRYCGCEDPESQKCVFWASERLQKELSGIIDNGYAVTYKIAHDIIKKAAEEPEHFIVGSRGSVGSSFAATMGDITEVNPLPAHYICPHCHYMEWGNKEGEETKYRSGYDLPEKSCPMCGEKLKTDGQNIPFETFLGFQAEKVPDIDLNFEEESQHRAHDYTKELLGADYVFRAGTIETVADKTAFGYVRGHLEKIGKDPNAEHQATIMMNACRCLGAKRTTGQHPGGIVVVPKGMSVLDFTPYQYPADDVTSSWYTTHFDFRSMHDEILKLDLLGHVDPLAMRKYRDLCSTKDEMFDIRKIPMNDPKVIGLFAEDGVKYLNLSHNYLNQQTGTLALPEFGTNLAQNMCITAKPRTFDDLLIISGLAHGTNVWANNAEDLIKSGSATLREVIGCRDDIMTYLRGKGLPGHDAFMIMEAVRKGKGLKEEQEALMRSHGVPDFYIDSCKKIAYLFPRGHAVAYVTMAVRVAWFKLYRPLEFYSVFFGYRSDDWDIKAMVDGEKATVATYQSLDERIKNRDPSIKPKDENIHETLKVAIEMFERGFHFAPIDLYRSLAKDFAIDYENKCLIPPFSVISGLGVGAAQTIVDAREKGPRFLSKRDLLERTSINSSNVAALSELGVLDDLSETNQMSLF